MPEPSETVPAAQAENKPVEESPAAAASSSTEASASTPTTSQPQPTSPSSPKTSPPPIITTPPAQLDPMNSRIQSETSLMATTPAAMETAMKFDEEAIRKSISAEEAVRKSMSAEAADKNAITEAPAAETIPEDEGAGLTVTLLILSGARTTFTINRGYLEKHNVSHSDPMQMTVYNLKECIWRDWKEDELNTTQPASPHLIRLILLGRLLEDKSLLKDCRLNAEAPNVVHLSLRPADVGEDEVTTKSGKFPTFSGSGGRGDRSSPGCRCVIL